MSKEFIPYEEALTLKELGFDEPCFGYYYLNSRFIEDKITQQSVTNIPAPLYQQAFRWFREKYGLFKQDYMFERKVQGYSFIIYDIINHMNLYDFCYNNDGELTGYGLNSYEEAELACLRKLIEIVKEYIKDE